MKRILPILVVLALAACGAAQPTPTPEITGSIKGNISNIEKGDAGILGYVRIEGEKIEGNEYDKAVVTVTDDTVIREKKGDQLVPATFDDLEFGELVECKFTGPVMESYPVQAKAAEIVILARMPKQ